MTILHDCLQGISFGDSIGRKFEKEYHTRSSSIKFVPPLVEPERVYRKRRRNNLAQVSQDLGTIFFEVLEDIRCLFLDSIGQQPSTRIMASWNANLYEALDITTFPGAPHAMLDKYHKWFPKFQGNNVI